jgi:predicted kinase
MSQHPSYTLNAMSLVYEISYAIIRKRLQQGQRVIFDASNYLSARRQRLFNIAAETGTPVAVCHVQAAQDVIETRLRQRANGVRGAGDVSEADWSVYRWMQERQEPLQREHLLVDTSSTPPAILAQNLYHYWSQIEANTESYFDLQPTRRTALTRFND